MTKKEMVFYFQEAQHLSWEKFQECMIQPDDDGDTCEDKILDVCICFPHHTMQAWSYFKAIYKDIPDRYKMRCLMNPLFQNYAVDYDEVLEMIHEYLKNETPELKAYRIETNRKLLEEAGVEDPDNFVVYRGIAEGYSLPFYAVS